MHKQKSTFFEKCALSALLIFITTVAFAVFCFMLQITLSPMTFFIPVITLVIISFIKDRRLFYGLTLNILLLAIFGTICRYIFDWSYDGMYYHKQAVITLKEGWNPLYQSCLDCDIYATYPNMALWLDNYPKGLWIFSAVLYSVTNLLETAKAVNILFISAVFFMAADTAKSAFNMSTPKSLLSGLLFAINPVFLSQMFTFYNDLTVGALTVIAILVCIKLYEDVPTNITYWVLFIITLSSTLIKFTSPALLAIVYIVFGIACMVKQRKNIRWMAKPVTVIVSGFIISLFVLGFDPYVEHITNGQNIVHPMLGDEKYDIMNTNPPEGFDEKNPIERVLISLISRSTNDISKRPEPKIPFTVTEEELGQITNPDTRIGGFGVLFSGILSLAVILLVIIIFKHKQIKTSWAIAMIMLLLMTLFFPESWWARYASFIYYLPILTVVYAAAEKKARILTLILSLLVILNSVITLRSVISAGMYNTAFVNSKLEEIKSENKKVILRVNDFPTHVKLFSEYGIDFEVKHEPISPGESIFYRNTKYKFID